MEKNTSEILMLQGDGIGSEISQATSRVLETINKKHQLNIKIISLEAGLTTLKSKGTTLPKNVLQTAKSVDGIIMGPMSTNDYPKKSDGGLNPSGEIRKQLDLFANIRPAKSLIGVPSPIQKKIDLVIVRENTEGFYSDRSMFYGSGEFMPTKDLAMSVRKVTREASTRIAEVAFELASTRLNRVAAIHKSNVFRLSDGLFLESVRAVKEKFPEIIYEEYIVDSMAARLIRDPHNFDVIVTTNMFGDILSDEASEISGGLGLAASINFGDNHAMAQAQHGSAPELAGKNIANPASLIGSTAMLLDWMGKKNKNAKFCEAGKNITKAIEKMMSSSKTRTKDLGGTNSTSGFAAELVLLLENS